MNQSSKTCEDKWAGEFKYSHFFCWIFTLRKLEKWKITFIFTYSFSPTDCRETPRLFTNVWQLLMWLKKLTYHRTSLIMLLYGIGLDATELCPLLKISSNKTTVDRKYQTNVIKSKKWNSIKNQELVTKLRCSKLHFY